MGKLHVVLVKGKTIVTCYHCKGNKKSSCVFSNQTRFKYKKENVKLQNNKEIDVKYPYLKMEIRIMKSRKIDFEKYATKFVQIIFLKRAII